MEILSRSRAVSDNDVGLFENVSISIFSGSIGSVTQLEETFKSSGGVLGTISIVSMREEHD